MSNAPTFIDLPPPPSDPVTPSDIPSRSGTPNSTTTSMSELSTVAIKDGHRGHLPHHSQPSNLSHQLDAERADRISRLTGLGTVTTARTPQSSSNLTPSLAAANNYNTSSTTAAHPTAVSYFDATGNPVLGRERSTVGSASATGSVGARTTWAGSEAGDKDFDKMSESQDMDMDTSSVGGMSDEGTPSLVGFGEGARTPARQSTIGSPAVMGGKVGTQQQQARTIDGVAAYEADGGTGLGGGTSATQQAERIVRENMDTTSADRMRQSQRPGALGRFEFEK